MSVLLENFDTLTSLGLKVIPLRQNTKIPIEKGWNKNWDLQKSREIVRKNSQLNLGLLLGEVVDVEGDNRQANQVILDLIGETPHPCYQSKKSIHHLFRSPFENFRIFQYEGLEFRGTGHQSVLPPSQHFGTNYEWISKGPFPVPQMPQKLINFLYKKLRKGKSSRRAIWCAICKQKFYQNKKRLMLEMEGFRMLGEGWQCRDCRMLDMRPICRNLKKVHR